MSEPDPFAARRMADKRRMASLSSNNMDLHMAVLNSIRSKSNDSKKLDDVAQ